MEPLAVVICAEAAAPAALGRALAALGPGRAGLAVWAVVHAPAAPTGQGPTPPPLAMAELLPQLVAAWPPFAGCGTLLDRRAETRTAASQNALVRAFAGSEAHWAVLLEAEFVPQPGLVAAYAAAAANGQKKPGLFGLWVGSNGRLTAGQPSPLAHFLAEQLKVRHGGAVAGQNVSADALGPANWAIHRHAFAAAGGLDLAHGAGLEAVDLARRLYATGHNLWAVPAARARGSRVPQLAEVVAGWRAQGRQLLPLLRRHRDPHGPARLAARLGPYRALVAQAPALQAQLQRVEDRLVALRRPQPTAIAELQPSFAQLYGTSVVQGLLEDPAAQDLWTTTCGKAAHA